jgi:hypothetical protein
MLGHDEKCAMSDKARMELKQFWRKVLQCEMMSEQVRQKLARRPNFNIMQAFYGLDKDSRGFLELE